MKKFLMYYLFLFLFSSFCFASQIDVKNDDISILDKSEVFIDDGASLSLEDIKQKANFSKYDSDFISLGYTTNEAVWIKFTLTNTTSETLNRVLHIDNSMLDSISLYDENIETNIGVMNRKTYNDIVDFYFTLDLKANETKTYYLRVLSNSCATYFHLNLETKDVLWSKNYKRTAILFFFMTILITLMIYNFFIFLFTKEKVYLYYVLMILGVVYNHFFSYTGMFIPIVKIFNASDEFIYNYTIVDAYLGIYYYIALYVFIVLFFMEVSQIKRYLFLYRYFLFLLAVAFFIVLVSAFSTLYLLDYLVYITFINLIGIFLSTIYLFYKKEENSSYLMIGFSLYVVGTIVFLLWNVGVYTPKNGYWYFYEISLALESILFSVVLSKKLNQTKALSNSLDTQKILLRELHHRVKNNLQFIISLYRLKLRSYLDSVGKEKLKEVENNVPSMGKIHDILHSNQTISNLNSSIYFEDLIKEIKRAYPNKNINFFIDTKDLVLNIDQAIYCGLIINELVTNSIKYAFNNENANISIILDTDIEKRYLLNISDNGKGFDWENKPLSFGLTLVERLVKDELKGELQFSNENGASFRILWS